jgi:hypothetical protein
MKPITIILTAILIIVSNVMNAQSFVTVNTTIDNFASSSTSDNSVHPFQENCNQKQIHKNFFSSAIYGGMRSVHFNGYTASCSDNKVTVGNGSLNIEMNEGGTQWVTTNLMYDAKQTEGMSLNTTGLNLDLKSATIRNAVFTVDFSDINSENDIFIKFILYSANNEYSEIPVKLSSQNFNTTVIFNTDSLRRNSASMYPVNLNKVGAIRMMVRTKGNTTLSVKNFNLSTEQNIATVNAVLQNVQQLNNQSFSWVNTIVKENSVKSQHIEASADGINFVTLNAVTNTSFNYTDKLQAYTSYRIKTTDAFGRITYSNIVKSSKISLAAEIKVFPTVVTSSTTILVNSEEETNISLQLFNNQGKIYLTKMLKISKGINTFVVPIPSTITGDLWISTINLANNNKSSFKIIKL